MKTIRVQTEEEFTTLVRNFDFRIVEAIVEGALSNLKTKKRFIRKKASVRWLCWMTSQKLLSCY